MTYRDDLQALEARHAALDAEVMRQTQERDRARSLLDQARERMRLPVLDQVRVASPCREAWDAMAGDDRVRHCGKCDKDVYNLSGMTRDEAEALLVEKNGKLCVRYFRRADGTILTSDCPVGKRRVRRRRLVIAGATVLVAAGVVASQFPNTPEERQAVVGIDQISEPVMGGSAAFVETVGDPAPVSGPVDEIRGQAIARDPTKPVAPTKQWPKHTAPHRR